MSEPKQPEVEVLQRAVPAVSAFHSITAFESAQRMANALARSDLVPSNFRNNLANCIIALEMSQRIGASPLAVMQNLNIIHGRPSWGAQFVIAALNACGLFSPLRFRVQGEGAQMQCHIEAIELSTGEVLKGPVVSMAMAEREGWTKDKPTRDGGTMVSKWKTMPDMMIRYRAATYFGRLYAPHILMGMGHTAEEIIDTEGAPDAGTTLDVPAPEKSKTDALNETIRQESGQRRKRAKDDDKGKADATKGDAPPPDATQSENPAPPSETAPEGAAAAEGVRKDFF